MNLITSLLCSEIAHLKLSRITCIACARILSHLSLWAQEIQCLPPCIHLLQKAFTEMCLVLKPDPQLIKAEFRALSHFLIRDLRNANYDIMFHPRALPVKNEKMRTGNERVDYRLKMKLKFYESIGSGIATRNNLT